MIRGLGWFVLTCALVAVLIPYPGLLPVSLIGFALVWFATPLTAEQRRGRAPKSPPKLKIGGRSSAMRS